LCCRFRPVLAELRTALTGENLAISALYRPLICLSETGTGRAQAGTTKSFPKAQAPHLTSRVLRSGQAARRTSSNSTPSPGGRSGQRACQHAQLGIPERRLTGRLWNTPSCLTAAPLTHSPPPRAPPTGGAAARRTRAPAAAGTQAAARHPARGRRATRAAVPPRRGRRSAPSPVRPRACEILPLPFLRVKIQGRGR
jgi:hypothetical protein